MKKEKTTVALIYDFDGTLSPGNMQEFGFMKAINKDKTEFWRKNKKLSEDNDASGILCYMYLMIEAAKTNGISLKRESFQKFGKDVELFNGVKGKRLRDSTLYQLPLLFIFVPSNSFLQLWNSKQR